MASHSKWLDGSVLLSSKRLYNQNIDKIKEKLKITKSNIIIKKQKKTKKNSQPEKENISPLLDLVYIVASVAIVWRLVWFCVRAVVGGEACL